MLNLGCWPSRSSLVFRNRKHLNKRSTVIANALTSLCHFSIFVKNKFQGYDKTGFWFVIKGYKMQSDVVFNLVPGALNTAHFACHLNKTHQTPLISPLVENPRSETGVWDKGDIQNVPWHSNKEFRKEVSSAISLLVTCYHFLTPISFGQAQRNEAIQPCCQHYEWSNCFFSLW